MTYTTSTGIVCSQNCMPTDLVPQRESDNASAPSHCKASIITNSCTCGRIGIRSSLYRPQRWLYKRSAYCGKPKGQHCLVSDQRSLVTARQAHSPCLGGLLARYFRHQNLVAKASALNFSRRKSHRNKSTHAPMSRHL